MKFTTIAFLAANAALATASTGLKANLVGRDLLPQISAANQTEVHFLHQWDPKEHLNEKRHNDHKPSPSPWHPQPSDSSKPSFPALKGDYPLTSSVGSPNGSDNSGNGSSGSSSSSGSGSGKPSYMPQGSSKGHAPVPHPKSHHGASKSWGPSQYHHGQKPTGKPIMKGNGGNSAQPSKGDDSNTDDSNGSNDNGSTNNGSTNNGSTNNGSSNIGSSSNGSNNNGDNGSGSNSDNGNGSNSDNGNGNSSGNDSTSSTKGDGGKPSHWPSASARSRLPHDKSTFALYGQAAAQVCGLTSQISGAEITACPLENGGSGWDCINTASTLESCGGCLSLGQGTDCTVIKGVDTVGCTHGKCVIGSCAEGFWLDSDKMECVAN